jgi:hypothetical protein
MLEKRISGSILNRVRSEVCTSLDWTAWQPLRQSMRSDIYSKYLIVKAGYVQAARRCTALTCK